MELDSQRVCVTSQGQENSLEKEIATHSSILTWKTPWTEKPGGLQSMGLQTLSRDSTHAHSCFTTLRSFLLWLVSSVHQRGSAVCTHMSLLGFVISLPFSLPQSSA